MITSKKYFIIFAFRKLQNLSKFLYRKIVLGYVKTFVRDW